MSFGDVCLTQFTPDSGPVDGGTLVTIHGRNFGGEAASVSAKLASVECSIERRNDSLCVHVLTAHFLVVYSCPPNKGKD